MIRNGDVYSGIFFIVYAIVLFIATFSIRQLDVATIGSDFVPRLVLGGMFILSAILVIQGLRKRKAEEDHRSTEKEQGEKANYKSVLSTIALMIGYVALIDLLGFLISTVVYLVLQFILLTDRSHWKIPMYVVIAIVTSGLIYYIFRMVLHVMLPTGILG